MRGGCGASGTARSAVGAAANTRGVCGMSPHLVVLIDVVVRSQARLPFGCKVIVDRVGAQGVTKLSVRVQLCVRPMRLAGGTGCMAYIMIGCFGASPVSLCPR